MNIKICNRCKGFDINKVKKALDKNFCNVVYEIGCNNMCGIGRDKVVVIVNNKSIIADSINELINKIKNLSF